MVIRYHLFLSVFTGYCFLQETGRTKDAALAQILAENLFIKEESYSAISKPSGKRFNTLSFRRWVSRTILLPGSVLEIALRAACSTKSL